MKKLTAVILYLIVCVSSFVYIFTDSPVMVGKFWIAAVLIGTQVLTLIFTVYQITVSIIGLAKKRKETAYIEDSYKRFALIVAAHNEEKVVGQLVSNLHQLDYPKSHYDIFVICDNCTDRTADIVRQYGGIAMERHDPARRGKGYGLEWMFKNLWEMETQGKCYDAVAMFDADNLVSKNFLQVINQKLNQGYEVVQGYLDTKNPSDSWITKSYAFAYWTTSQVFQLAREKIGLSAQLGGTGVVVATKVLKDIGWGATSLTEDLEFTARYVLITGKRVAWAHEAKIYDEKPLDMKASWKQRVRWMSGHSDCMIRLALPLLKKAVKQRSLVSFDVAMYLLQPSRILLSIASMAFLFLAVFSAVYNHSWFVLNHWVWVFTIIPYYSLPIIGVLLERKGKAAFWIFFVYVFSLTWIPITIIGFIKRKNKVWSHTKHDRTLSLDEVTRLT